MTKKKRKFNLEKYRRFLPYAVIGLATLALVFIGSRYKTDGSLNLSLDVFAASDYKVSVDQMSELYMVADLSDALGLASASDVASNYVVANTMYSVGQASGGKLEKPTLPNIGASRGVVEYVVADGDTMESIASKYSVTTDQIRWSNGLKTTDISAGDTLYVPSKPGIVYTVKADETIEGIVDKYGSNTAEIIALNDLEVSGISEGMKILIKDGTLPEKERPEYVAPRPTYTTPNYSYFYSYSGSAYSRQNVVVLGRYYGLGGPYGAGQCTQWAWYNRQDLPNNLGNAATWASRAAAMGYRVDRTPSPGAIFQTTAGWYGHVGYVEAVNSDGSITVTEMNYNYQTFVVIRATIPANAVGSFYYIH